MTLMRGESPAGLAGYPAMETSKTYREFAEQCEDLAKQAKDDHRVILMEMAEVWRKLADEADRKT
jgi:hypothetical protein